MTKPSTERGPSKTHKELKKRLFGNEAHTQTAAGQAAAASEAAKVPEAANARQQQKEREAANECESSSSTMQRRQPRSYVKENKNISCTHPTLDDALQKRQTIVQGHQQTIKGSVRECTRMTRQMKIQRILVRFTAAISKSASVKTRKKGTDTTQDI